MYRRYDINELAEHSTYEETVFLLLYGKLPDHAELSAFNEKLISYRHVTNLGYRYRLNRGHREMLKKFVSLKNGFWYHEYFQSTDIVIGTIKLNFERPKNIRTHPISL